MAGQRALTYAREPDLEVAEVRGVLIASGLGTIRPVDDVPRLRAMPEGADLVITGWPAKPGRPSVGIARRITERSRCCYLSEHAVARSAHRLGGGRGRLDEVRREVGPQESVVLASVPEAVGFHERAGMVRIAAAFWFRRER